MGELIDFKKRKRKLRRKPEHVMRLTESEAKIIRKYRALTNDDKVILYATMCDLYINGLKREY